MTTICQSWSLIIVSTFYLVINCEPDLSRSNYTAVFSKHQHWDGQYEYNNTQTYCNLFVHSQHYLKPNGLLATFSDKLGATIDMEGSSSSSNALEVLFSTHTMYAHMNRFPMNFTMRGILSMELDGWWFRATVIVPYNGLFGRIDLHQTDRKFGSPDYTGNNQAWRYVLIIGVPIILALVGTAGIIGLFVWAKKKGYMRHVDENYKLFNNPVRFKAADERVHI